MTKELKVTITNEESAQLNVDLDTFKTQLVDFKGNLHELAYKALVHFHNCGNVVYVQKLYDILNEDKLLRKSAFAKWILEYAPAVFSDESKKFSKNKNPNSGKFLYMDNQEQGSTLLAAAYAKRFWDIAGGEESVTPTTWDVFAKNMEKMLKRATKDTEKGEMSAEEITIMNNVVSNFNATMEIVTPLTTKSLMEKVVEAETTQVA